MNQIKYVVRKTWSIYIGLLLVICVAFALRLINIEAFSFWTDEGLTPLRASYPIMQILQNDVVIQGIVTKDTHPPFFYLVIHLSHQLFGNTDFAYRFPSALSGVLLVPVMFQFGRQLRGVGLGFLVAALTAVNPLQIWYANEARMYTLLVLLLALASYVLWRALRGAPLVRSLVLYAMLAGLAFYTHYTAVFLIAVQALFWMWLLWQNGQKKLIIGTIIIGAIAAIPMVPYTIPRLFTGAEANFYFVNPQTMLKDVIRFFNLGLTVDFSQTTIQLINILSAGLLFLGVYAAKTWECRLFLLSYLLAIVFGLMVGSIIFKPMYQGVRHIMAGSPAFILLIGFGIVFAWEKTHKKRKTRWVWVAAGTTGLIVAFLGAFISLNNLYNKPEIYAKDDFRDLIAQIEAQASQNDVIVYNNAILLPLHEHYRKRNDIPVTAVPAYPYLADQTAFQDLTKLSEKYERIWFVTDPPADKRDKDGITREWLQENLTQVSANNALSHNTSVESLTFATAPSEVDTLPENSEPLNIQWENLPTLRGINLENNQPIAQSAIWFNLFWEGILTESNAKIRFSLQDQTGQEWLSDIQTLTKHKNGTQTRFQQVPYHLTIPIGLPPGTYTLTAQPLAPDSVTPLGDSQPLTELTIASQHMATEQKWPDHQHILFENDIELLGWQFPEAEVRPGHNLPITLYWQTNELEQLDTIQYELSVIKPDGSLLRTQTESPGAEWLTQWPTDTPIMEKTGLYFRPETEPGTYYLQWRLLDGENTVRGKPFWRPWSTETIKSGEVTVIPWPLKTELPTDVTSSTAAFGPIQLYGYRETHSDSDHIAFDLVWKTVAKPETNYFLFVHLIDPDSNIVAQTDLVPGNTLRPTVGWREGEVIEDFITLNLPSELAAGKYQILIGFYDPETGVRLPASIHNEPQASDSVELFSVTIP